MIIEDGVEQPEVSQPPAAKPGKEPETITLTKAEHAALMRERDEARESERYWATQARGGHKEPEAEEEPIETAGLIPEVTGNEDLDEAIFNDPDKWTDALSKGPRAVGQYIKTLGLVNAQQAAEIAVKAARQTVASAVAGMQTDQKLVGDFKELQDPKSELFKTAAPIYQEAVRMNGGKQSSALLWAAAKAAKAQLEAKAPPEKQRREDDDYDRYEPEEDRRSRAAAQGAERGRRAPVPDEDADIGPEALAICKAMNIKPEDFLKSQRELAPRRRK